VITTCRSVAGFLHLLEGKKSLVNRLYKAYFKFHSYYWVAFGFFLVLHLMVTIVHIGVPTSGEPYLLAHQVVFYSAIFNFLAVIVLFTSCRSFLSLVGIFTPGKPLSGGIYRRFYKLHSIFWALLAVSFATHIITGIIHAVNT
jgi:hypothetical protein